MRVPEYTFVLDQTGKDPRNLVQKERRTITAANRPKYNCIIPHAAPFYARSLTIRHVPSNTVLTEGVHYAFGYKFEKAMVAVKDAQPIYSAIMLFDRGIVGDFEISYQTLGGRYTLNAVKITEILANALENPRVVDWEQVVGVPISFPPYNHQHDLETDLTAAPELKAAIKEVADAIRAIQSQDESEHPGYEQVITELFRLDRKDKALQVELDKIKLQISESVNSGIEGISVKFREIESAYKAADAKLQRDLTAVINNHVTTINGTINRNAAKATNDLNTFKTSFTNTVNGQFTTMGQRIDALNTTLTGRINTVNTTLTNTINTKERELRALIGERDSNARTLIANLTTSVNNNNRDIRRDFAAADTTLRNLINSEVGKINTKISSSIDTAIRDIRSELTGSGSSQAAENTALRKLISDLTTKERNNHNANKALIDAIPAKITAAKNEVNGKVTTLNNTYNAYVSSNNTRVTALETGLRGKASVADITSRISSLETKLSGQYIPLSKLPPREYSTVGAKIPTNSRLVQFVGNTNNIHIGQSIIMTSYNAGAGHGTIEYKPNSENSFMITGQNLQVRNLKLLSDIRYKKDVEVIDSALDKIVTLTGITYRMKDDETRQGGLIAQEVEKVLPEAVSLYGEGENEMLTLNYSAVVGMMVNAIKELKAENIEMKQLISRLGG